MLALLVALAAFNALLVDALIFVFGTADGEASGI